MKYSPVHDKFIISHESLKLASMELMYAMQKARDISGAPRGVRQFRKFEELDNLEKGIIDAAKSLGIEFACGMWGCDLDLTTIK